MSHQGGLSSGWSLIRVVSLVWPIIWGSAMVIILGFAFVFVFYMKMDSVCPVGGRENAYADQDMGDVTGQREAV